MDDIKTYGTAQFPDIDYNPEAGSLLIRGNSLPNDAITFYSPVMNWLYDYLKNPQPQTVVTFQMSYYNSSTAKAFYLILKQLEEFHAKGQGEVKVIWLSPFDDPDMKEAGMDYANKLDLPFEFGSFQENDI